MAPALAASLYRWKYTKQIRWCVASVITVLPIQAASSKKGVKLPQKPKTFSSRLPIKYCFPEAPIGFWGTEKLLHSQRINSFFIFSHTPVFGVMRHDFNSEVLFNCCCSERKEEEEAVIVCEGFVTTLRWGRGQGSDKEIGFLLQSHFGGNLFLHLLIRLCLKTGVNSFHAS